MSSIDVGSATTTGYDALLTASDERLPRLAPDGLSLFDCLRHIPAMTEFLGSHGVSSPVIRGKMTARERRVPTFRKDFQIVIHPGARDHIDAFFSNCRVNANDIERLNFTELPSGGVITWHEDLTTPILRFNFHPAQC